MTNSHGSEHAGALVLRPSHGVRWGYALLFVALGLIILAGLKDWPPSGAADWIALALALACLLAAASYPLRAVVLTDDSIRVRSLGVWKRRSLPKRLRLDPGLSLGSLYLVDDASGEVLVILKREFGPLEVTRARVAAWLRERDRRIS